MTKAEKIKEAYGDFWDYFKDKVDSNGWIKDRDFWGDWPENISKINWETTDHDNDYYDTRRPLSLKGIEHNNGWIKIESEDDLPKDSCDVIAFLENGETYVQKFIIHYKDFSVHPKRYITHYKMIEAQEPPIY